MKIRLSMEGMSLSVDVGDKANYLFIKFANQLLCNGTSSEEVENIADKLQKHEEPDTSTKSTQKNELKTESGDSALKYKGFIYWKCNKCGSTRGFCLKKESKGIHCMSCGDDSLFEEPLKPLYANCECGQHFKYMTNINEEMFDMDCMECGAPIPIKWNGHDMCYQTIKN